MLEWDQEPHRRAQRFTCFGTPPDSNDTRKMKIVVTQQQQQKQKNNKMRAGIYFVYLFFEIATRFFRALVKNLFASFSNVADRDG